MLKYSNNKQKYLIFFIDDSNFYRYLSPCTILTHHLANLHKTRREIHFISVFYLKTLDVIMMLDYKKSNQRLFLSVIEQNGADGH